MKYDFASLYILESQCRVEKKLGYSEESPLDVYGGIFKALSEDPGWIVPNLQEEIVALFICPPNTKQNWNYLDQERHFLWKCCSGRYTIMKFYPVRMDGVYYMVMETELSAVPHIIGINQMGLDFSIAETAPAGFPCTYIQIEDSDSLAFTTFDYDVEKQADSDAVVAAIDCVKGSIENFDFLSDLSVVVGKINKRINDSINQANQIMDLDVDKFIHFKAKGQSEETSLFSQKLSKQSLVDAPIATVEIDGTKDYFVHHVAVSAEKDPFITLAETWGYVRVSQPVSGPIPVNAFVDGNKATHFVIAW